MNRRIACAFDAPFPKNMLIHVLLAVDARQVIGCAVSMRSIMENASSGARLRFHVMTHRVPASDVEVLRATVVDGVPAAEVEFYEIDASRFAHLMRSKLISHTAYARLIIGGLLPSDVERCIYLDCDMVVMRDIVEAWDFSLEGKTVAAVANANPVDARANQVRLGLLEASYFNSGFIVIDVRRWRDLQVGARALKHAEMTGDRLVLHDQDALNCALQGDWIELPREWNVGLATSDWLVAGSRAVFHYWGAPKPWHADYDGRFHDLFLRYLDRTAYAGRRPWNPLGIGAFLSRARRRMPYPPAVVRWLRNRFGLARTPARVERSASSAP